MYYSRLLFLTDQRCSTRSGQNKFVIVQSVYVKSCNASAQLDQPVVIDELRTKRLNVFLTNIASLSKE